MKKIITYVSLVLMIVILSVALVACVNTESKTLSTGTYKFYSMSGSMEGIEINVKVGDSIMGVVTLTEDYVTLEIKEDGEAVLSFAGEAQNCTWEEKDGKYYLTVEGESQEITVNGDIVKMEEEGMKLELKKA